MYFFKNKAISPYLGFSFINNFLFNEVLVYKTDYRHCYNYPPYNCTSSNSEKEYNTKQRHQLSYTFNIGIRVVFKKNYTLNIQYAHNLSYLRFNDDEITSDLSYKLSGFSFSLGYRFYRKKAYKEKI